MERGNHTIWIEAEGAEYDIQDNNVDVIVTFDNKERWVASFYTYSNVTTLVEKNKVTGECLGGKYLWGSDMILIDEVSRQRIEEVIHNLLYGDEPKGIFECMFTRLPDEEDDEDYDNTQ